jgi:hypothetical protein
MLSNHLTLDDEDAVQAELRELQVRQPWFIEPIGFSDTVYYSCKRQNRDNAAIFPQSQQQSQPIWWPTASSSSCGLLFLAYIYNSAETDEPEREQERVPLPA